jgi:hypothetical protein
VGNWRDGPTNPPPRSSCSRDGHHPRTLPRVVTGSDTFTDAARVEATLARLLSRRRQTHDVVLVCGPETLGRVAASWDINGLAVGACGATKFSERSALGCYAWEGVLPFDGSRAGHRSESLFGRAGLMTPEDRHIARVLFANRVYKSNGTAFQQLFAAVLQRIHGQGFVAVRPQGALGDQGNDGYVPANGHYFQVYGPVDPEEKVTLAADKLATDYAKLKKNWSQATPIQAYSFVFNDKYEGVFTEIAKALAKLAKSQKIPCLPYTAAHLEDDFLRLTPDQMQGVLGQLLPDPSRVTMLDFGTLRDMIDHIMHIPARAVATRFGELPDLGEKVRLNHLNKAYSDLIHNAARKAGRVEQFFAKNSTFSKQALKDHLVAAYFPVRDAGRRCKAIPKGVTREDLVFADFRQSLLPADANGSTEDALDILIGYYFEACDVFDPHADRQAANASP